MPSDYDGSPSLELTGKDFNYLIRALRLKEGQKIMGRDRNGCLWDLCITHIGRSSCTLSSRKTESASSRTDALPESRPLRPIILYQCLPKGRKADDIIKKATEAGVRDIVLVRSANCVANLEGKEESRLGRYDALVAEAIQQSGSLVPTKVYGVIGIEDIPRRSEGKKRRPADPWPCTPPDQAFRRPVGPYGMRKRVHRMHRIGGGSGGRT